MLKCEQIMTLPKDSLDPAPMGPPLDSTRMIQVERAVLRAIGVPA